MKSIIELSNINKVYPGANEGVHALRGLNLKISEGVFAALMGPSGSGKSTLLNICGLIDEPSDGVHFFDGQDCSSLSETELTRIRREKIGFIFQNFNLIPVMSLFENVEYPLILANMPIIKRQAKVLEIIEAVGLLPFKDHLPDQISGGQRQRVAIARALIKEPRLVIADEPTANLDSTTATQVIDLMHALAAKNNTTFLIATHDNRMADRCGLTLHLQDGVIC